MSIAVWWVVKALIIKGRLTEFHDSYKHLQTQPSKVFCKKKSVLRNFEKFTGKHLCHSIFFNKVAGLRPKTLLKKTLAQVFSCEFCGISKNIFSKEHLRTTASAFNQFQAYFRVCKKRQMAGKKLRKCFICSHHLQNFLERNSNHC